MTFQQQITQHLDLLDRLAQRRFASASMAEEAVIFAVERLAADNGQRLQAYDGRSRFATYLAAVVLRLFEDFSRQRFGRRRPPVWLQKLGTLWLRVYTLLCLERRDMLEILDIMSQQHDLSQDSISAMGDTIRANITDCGSPQGQEVAFGEEHTPTGGKMGGHGLEDKQKEIFFKALFCQVMGEAKLPNILRHFPQLTKLASSLSGQEKMLLKLCYQDGLAVSEAGRLVGLSANQTHGKMRRLLQRLRQGMVRAGLAAEILACLQK